MNRGIDLIEKLSRISESEQKMLIEYYANVNMINKIKIHTTHRDVLNMLYSNEDNIDIKEQVSLDVMSYISFVLAIKSIYLKKPIDSVEILLNCSLKEK